jgi:hypothetical protein
MCDSADGNWVWSLRDKATGKPVTTRDGYTYFFAEEADALAQAERIGRESVELVHTREPGA